MQLCATSKVVQTCLTIIVLTNSLVGPKLPFSGAAS